MKTRKTTKTALFVVTAALSAQALAENGPSFYGGLDLRTVDTKQADMDTSVYIATLGAKGNLPGGTGISKVLYTLEADLSNTNDGDDQIDVLQAKVILPTQIGTFVAGKTRSGQHANLVGPVDVFKTNTPNNRVNGNSLFHQGAYVPRVLAYKTPQFAGFNLVGAVATLNNNDGSDADATVFRLEYKNGPFKAAAGQVMVDANTLGADKDYLRRGLGLSYDVNNLHLGFAYENNADDPGKQGEPKEDSDVMGVAATYKIDKVKLGLGYTIKDFDAAAREDDALVTMFVGSDLNEYISLWFEAGKYDIDDKDNASIGISLSL